MKQVKKHSFKKKKPKRINAFLWFYKLEARGSNITRELKLRPRACFLCRGAKKSATKAWHIHFFLPYKLSNGPAEAGER